MHASAGVGAGAGAHTDGDGGTPHPMIIYLFKPSHQIANFPETVSANAHDPVTLNLLWP